MRSHVGMLWILAAVTLTPAAHAAQARNSADLADATSRSQDVGLGAPRSDVIVSWNNLAHDLAFAEDQFLTFKGQRALAMMHLAIHDALNAIERPVVAVLSGGNIAPEQLVDLLTQRTGNQ